MEAMKTEFVKHKSFENLPHSPFITKILEEEREVGASQARPLLSFLSRQHKGDSSHRRFHGNISHVQRITIIP